MDLTQAIILALIQGITEFLPVSSSAHLILLPLLTDWPDQGIAFDVALNTATLLAVVIYLRSDIIRIILGFWRLLACRSWQGNSDGRLAVMVLAATVPVGLAGLFAHDIVADQLRTIEVIAWSSIVWGIGLWLADRRPGERSVSGINWRAGIVVGIAQAVALIPGTSRSGITITAGLFMGLSRTAAARFSFLLAVVVGILAGGKEGVELLEGSAHTPWLAISIGFVVAFITAFGAIHFFLKLISRSSMTPFVVYRVLLGVVLLLMT
ncbi:MAG: undecaprenyl-diphosphate phosphatase [Deltaproteobacteria bacterium]|nr:undecaprenyl-diphosphate phosphatase [Deltaproteobacteria bacterium]